MESQNGEIPTFKKEMLAVFIKEGATEDFIKVVIEGIDRIESSLPSLQTHAEKEAVLELYISNHYAKTNLKREKRLSDGYENMYKNMREHYDKMYKNMSDDYKNMRDDYKKMNDEARTIIGDQSALIDEMSAFRKVQKNIIQQLQETLTNTEKIYPN